MKKRIGVFTKDFVLYNKIRLLLRNAADVELLRETDSLAPYALVFEDVDTSGLSLGGTVKMSRIGMCDLPLPFRHEELLNVANLAEAINADRLIPDSDGRHVYLGDERIKLTEIEYKLLLALMSSSEDFVSREKLLTTVWGEGFDPGVVNVYIHYLRSKLETDGRKIILSSRKEGYGIDKKYRRDK